MNESSLKSALMQEIRKRLPGFVALRHEDVRTAGIPDLSLTGLDRTSWWEFKLANPRLTSVGIQELTMLRLEGAGIARYIVWEERKGIRRTLVIKPRDFIDLIAEETFAGFNHVSIVEWMLKLHGGR